MRETRTLNRLSQRFDKCALEKNSDEVAFVFGAALKIVHWIHRSRERGRRIIQLLLYLASRTY